LWHNITGELLRFADRRYYDAWWESVSLNEFYRKWNFLVQDWLFAYIYVPVWQRTKSRSMAIYSVILLSGLAHEYIIAFSIQFFFPVLFVVFAGCGRKWQMHFQVRNHHQCLLSDLYFLATRNLKRTNAHNTIFLMLQMLGWALISSLYCMEYYSRTNCPTLAVSTHSFTNLLSSLLCVFARITPCWSISYLAPCLV